MPCFLQPFRGKSASCADLHTITPRTPRCDRASLCVLHVVAQQHYRGLFIGPHPYSFRTRKRTQVVQYPSFCGLCVGVAFVSEGTPARPSVGALSSRQALFCPLYSLLLCGRSLAGGELSQPLSARLRISLLKRFPPLLVLRGRPPRVVAATTSRTLRRKCAELSGGPEGGGGLRDTPAAPSKRAAVPLPSDYGKTTSKRQPQHTHPSTHARTHAQT